MKVMVVQGLESADEPVTYGTLTLQDDGTVVADPPDSIALVNLLGDTLIVPPDFKGIPPGDPRWFEALPLAYAGSRFWVKPTS